MNKTTGKNNQTKDLLSRKDKEEQISISPEDLRTLGALIHTAENMKNAYFWTPPSIAYARRALEKKNSFDTIEWEEQGHRFTASYTVDCSCKYIYAFGRYYRDGSRTTLTAIRNSYNRMVKEMK